LAAVLTRCAFEPPRAAPRRTPGVSIVVDDILTPTRRAEPSDHVGRIAAIVRATKAAEGALPGATEHRFVVGAVVSKVALSSWMPA
jgi:hypothetical protein